MNSFFTGGNMKKIVLGLVVASFVMGCSSWRKKSGTADGSGQDSGAPVVTETTGAGGNESVSGSGMNFAPTGSDSGTIEGLQTVHFEYDRSSINSAERNKLQKNAAWMKKNSGIKVTIEGHCDQRGSTEYNLALGERRANAVKQTLIGMGVSANRLTTVSYGKEKLIASGDSEADMAQNRRANFVPAN